jgi:hypothetical protein
MTPYDDDEILPFDAEAQVRERTIHPRRIKDLVLAPVAAGIDLNLQQLRDRSAAEVEAGLELGLDAPAEAAGRDARAQLVLDQALRNVDMHGWAATITTDANRVHLDGGSVTLDLGLSAGITEYIERGV